MVARGAQRNPSIFRREQCLLPLDQVAESYLKNCIRTGVVYQNMKYALMCMWPDHENGAHESEGCDSFCRQRIEAAAIKVYSCNKCCLQPRALLQAFSWFEHKKWIWLRRVDLSIECAFAAIISCTYVADLVTFIAALICTSLQLNQWICGRINF